MRGQPADDAGASGSHPRPEPELDADPFCHDLPPGKPGYAPGGQIVTGLSDEDDAHRELALRFNTDLRFCPNCETIMDSSKIDEFHQPWCTYCGDTLKPVGTPPRRRKFEMK